MTVFDVFDTCRSTQNLCILNEINKCRMQLVFFKLHFREQTAIGSTILTPPWQSSPADGFLNKHTVNCQSMTASLRATRLVGPYINGDESTLRRDARLAIASK